MALVISFSRRHLQEYGACYRELPGMDIVGNPLSCMKTGFLERFSRLADYSEVSIFDHAGTVN